MEFDDGHHHHHRSEEEILMMNENTNSNNNANHSNNSSSLNRVKMVEALSHVQIQPTPAPEPAMTQSLKPRYRECMKNQAINVMGHAVDGCGEFLPAGPDGSLEALKCAACSCHRNFHRREEAGDTAAAAFLYSHHHQPPSGPFGSHYRTTPSSGYLHLGPPPQPRPSTSGEDDDVLNPNGVAMGSGGNSNGKKRFRSKFTAEQKAKMLAMAERIEWRIQKCDDELLQQFFHETNVKRQVFKVWMHNNKHTLAKANNNNHNSSSCNSSRQQLMT